MHLPPRLRPGTALPGPSAPAVRAAAPGPAGILEARDLRGLGWWVITQTIAEALEPPRASVITSVLRTLATLGPEPLAEEEALREVELRGRIMHGLPPATAREWERAAAVFSDDALEEFRRWERSGSEVYGDDGLEPFGLVE